METLSYESLFPGITQSKSVVKLKGFCPLKYSKVSFKIYMHTQQSIQCRFNWTGENKCEQ